MYALTIDDDDLVAAANELAAQYAADGEAIPPPVLRAAVMGWLERHIRDVVADLPWYVECAGSGWEEALHQARKRPPRLLVRRRPWPYEDYEVWLLVGASRFPLDAETTRTIHGLGHVLRSTARWRGIPLVMRYYPEG